MTTNDELKELMAKVLLTQPQVAEFTESSVDTVKGWCTQGETRRRNMPASKLKLLKRELHDRNLLPGDTE